MGSHGNEVHRTNLSIVIPIFNEVENILTLIEEVKAVCACRGYKYEIIIVDDGSTDGGGEAVAGLVPITVIRFRRNFGQTAAFDAGIRAAKYEFIVTMDGDGQNDPADIPRLVDHLLANDLDVVSGWRVIRKDKFSKRFISRGAYFLRKIFLHDPIRDSGCSLKIYRRECLDKIRLYGEIHRFIPALLQMKGYSIGEIPVNHRSRRAGRTKYNYFRTLKGFADIMLLWFWRSYAIRPIHLLGGLGCLFIAFAALFGLRTFYLFIMDRKLSSTLEPLLTVFTFITGLLFLSLGIVTDILIKIYYAVTDQAPYSVRDVTTSGDAGQVSMRDDGVSMKRDDGVKL
jgi:glycosyltransferase involved in cell wall biosynthesis